MYLLRSEFFLFGAPAMKEEQKLAKRYRIDEAAQRLGISVVTLRRKVHQREVGCYRPSGPRHKILFSEEHLEEFEQRHTINVEADRG
jgi:excisionase family DNA binding protein